MPNCENCDEPINWSFTANAWVDQTGGRLCNPGDLESPEHVPDVEGEHAN